MLAISIILDIEKALRTKEYSSIKELKEKISIEICNIALLFY